MKREIIHKDDLCRKLSHLYFYNRNRSCADINRIFFTQKFLIMGAKRIHSTETLWWLQKKWILIKFKLIKQQTSDLHC